MDHKQPLILHELLQQHQDPFHLKTYISDKRSQLTNSSPAAAPESCGCAFLHVPSRTAAVLVEAAMRIQKQRQSKPKTQRLSLFGSFLKILKHRSREKVERKCDFIEREKSEEIRISLSCSRLCRDEFRTSTTSASFHDSADFEARFGLSPISKSPSISGRRLPDLCSPATSPIRRVKQEEEIKENCVEQCSPVSVLESFCDDHENESLVREDEEEEEEDDDYDPERSYANIERARQQLLERLERFEKLAALDHVDLEQKLLEASEIEGVEFEQSPLCRKQDSDTSRLKQSPMIGEDKFKVVLGRSCCSSWRLSEVEFEEYWERSAAAVEETAAEMEVAIFEELMEQCFCN